MLGPCWESDHSTQLEGQVVNDGHWRSFVEFDSQRESSVSVDVIPITYESLILYLKRRTSG